jgi:malonyl-CoA O-methyltransferase
MLSAPIDTRLVRRLFSRPEKIVAAEFLHREIATRMREKLELVRIHPSRVLDAGCGMGTDLPELQRIYPDTQLLGLDAAAEMLRYIKDQQKTVRGVFGRLFSSLTPAVLKQERGAGLVAGDFAQLPFASQTLDLIWSNLALHWHPQPDLVFAEWRRVLRTDGLLMFSCFGPDTLIELRQAFAQADAAPHVLPFVDMHDFGDMLVNAGFSTPVMDMEKISLTYQDVDTLFADVRALGGNPLSTRRRGLAGRDWLVRVRNALEKQRSSDGKIILTVEVVYGHAFRPVSRKTAAGESIVRFDLPKKSL